MSRSIATRLATGAGVLVSVLVYCALTVGSLLTARPAPLASLRTAFWHDQLGYLSIVADVASGDFANHEPVTQTGVNHYPRNYYSLVGLIAHVLQWDPVLAWNATSMLLQAIAVGALAFALARVSGRAWMSFLAPLPFFGGVMAFDKSGDWYRSLDSHAVLWGPYGVMFSNNGEAAGLSVIVLCLSALAAVWLRTTGRTARVTVSVICAALLGVLSGFQTYSFISGAFVVAYLLAARFLLPARRSWWVLATVIALLVALLLGPAVSERAGQLPTLVFGLLPAAPGLIRGVIRSRGVLAAYCLIYAAAAAPQIAWTMSGVLSGDPFLTYRVASNVDLGVGRPDTLIASLVFALPLVAIVVLGRWYRRSDAAVFAAAMLVTWSVLALNDLWGVNAEPYRLWIDMFLLSGVVAVLSIARLHSVDPVVDPSRGVGARTPSPQHRTRARRLVGAVAWTLVGTVYAVSLLDFVDFRSDADMSATWDATDARDVAIAALARQATTVSPGLILTDPCVDPRTTKVTSASPLAFYYLGMAWPRERDAVQAVMNARDAASVDAAAMADADVQWILSDSECDRPLAVPRDAIDEVASVEYDDPGEKIRLLRYTAP